MSNVTEQEKQQIQQMAQNFVKRLHIGKVFVLLITLIPVFELLYFCRGFF